MPSPIVTLLTDFGSKDGYVAAMKGVILSLCPGVQLVDVSHRIPPQDVRAGAFVLWSVYRYFPADSIHVSVVDPGVGTSRRGLAIRTPRGFFVGPDNGSFSLVLADEPNREAFSLENPELRLNTVSATFHGRDIFAPAAAHLALGTEPQKFGPPLRPLNPEWGRPVGTSGGLSGEVLHCDHFGNLITNLRESDLAGAASPQRIKIHAAGFEISGLSRTYADVAEGAPAALIGSHGLLEIAVNRGNAAKELDMKAGDGVEVIL